MRRTRTAGLHSDEIYLPIVPMSDRQCRELPRELTPLLIYRIQSHAAKRCCYFRRTARLRMVCASVIASDLIQLCLPVVQCPGEKTKHGGNALQHLRPHDLVLQE